MKNLKPYEIWLITGCQGLYGEEVVQKVESNSRKIAEGFQQDERFSYPIIFKKVVKSSDEIFDVMSAANLDENCAGVITWMHTFSPGKMWIKGLNILRKPMLHLNTQMDKEIPWSTFDMDYMNLNQSAHGDREFGFITSRLRKTRAVVTGYWKDDYTRNKLKDWMNSSVAITESQSMKIARFGDNMREVAVTDGDKIEAQITLGWTIDTYPAGDLAEMVEKISEEKVNQLMAEYEEMYNFTENGKKSGAEREAICYQAKLEIAIEEFLDANGYTAFVTCFQDLHGLKQLPGLAAQNLMAKGYGFGGEGDWKTAGIVRIMKVMSGNISTSFMEDYIYSFGEFQHVVLGSHMLEICPTISESRPNIEVHPLFVGDREDPARLVFKSKAGEGINAALVDMGNRFRLVINKLTAIENPNDLPNLPVASVLWETKPSLSIGAEAWIIAGGGHHFGFSLATTAEQMEIWAKQIGVECIIIDESTTIHQLENEIRWNELAYKL